MFDELKLAVEVVSSLGVELASRGVRVDSPEVPFAQELAKVLLKLSMSQLTELRQLSKQSAFINSMTSSPAQRALVSIGRISDDGWALFMQARLSIEGPNGSRLENLEGTPGHSLLVSSVSMSLREDRARIASSRGMHELEDTAESRDQAARADLIFDNFEYYWGKAADQFDTVEKLATAAKVSPVTILGLKHRKGKPQMRTLVKIARTLGVEIEQLTRPRKS